MTAAGVWNGAAAPDRARLLELLRQRAYERREVVLASGRRSNFYIDCRRVVLTAEGHVLVGRLLYHAVVALCPEVVAVGGMTMGADPLVSAVALTSHGQARTLDGFYVRKQPKGHGTGQWLEGAELLPRGAQVAIFEDVVTSGGSALDAVHRAREAGFVPVRVLALVDRQEGGREAIERELPLTSVFAAEDFSR